MKRVNTRMKICTDLPLLFPHTDETERNSSGKYKCNTYWYPNVHKTTHTNAIRITSDSCWAYALVLRRENTKRHTTQRRCGGISPHNAGVGRPQHSQRTKTLFTFVYIAKSRRKEEKKKTTKLKSEIKTNWFRFHSRHMKALWMCLNGTSTTWTPTADIQTVRRVSIHTCKRQRNRLHLQTRVSRIFNQMFPKKKA